MSHLASLPATQATKSDFWRRLLFGPRTILRTFQDVLFGIFVPLLCFAIDPGVMFGGDRLHLGWGLPTIASLSILTVAGLSMIALLVLLVFGGRWGRLDAVLAGILLAGAAVAFVVALGLLPASMMGLLFVIGVLGFLPFFTAIVCLRNAARTLASPPARMHRALAAGTTLAVLLLAAAYQVAADRAIDAMLTDIARTGNPAAIARLQAWRPLLPQREVRRRGFALVSADGVRSEEYEIAYRSVTGEELWPGGSD